MGATLTKQDLDDLLGRRLNGYCHVNVKNAIPPEYGMTIGGACRFFYQDTNGNPDGEYSDYHNTADVPSGSTLSFKSDRTNGCVRRTVVVAVIIDNQGRKQTLTAGREVAANECMRYDEYTVGPTATVSISSSSTFELRHISF